MTSRAMPTLRPLLLVCFVIGAGFALLAQESGESGDGDKPQEKKPTAEEQAKAERERQEKITGLFGPTKLEFLPKKRVSLHYDFNTDEHGLAEDFSPEIESVAKRMRWSRGWEGWSGWSSRGVVVNKRGSWLHKAVWTEVEIEILYGQLSEIMKNGDVIAAVYTWDRGKTLVGANLGQQCIRLRGFKHAKAPIPKQSPPLLRARQKITFGYHLENGVLTAMLRGKPRANTGDKPKFLKKLAPGHVGFAWNGQWVKGIVMSIKIKGTLDPEWLAKQ